MDFLRWVRREELLHRLYVIFGIRSHRFGAGTSRINYEVVVEMT